MSLVSDHVPGFVEKAGLSQETPNDASPLGVEIERVADPQQPHWRVIGVHHLTGPENMGNHNVFADVLDEDGVRIDGAHLLAVNNDLPPALIRIDKPPQEPGTNFPMFKNDTYSVAVHRPDDAPLPSDRVINLHTRHPDEDPGNTLFHHSFFVVFQQTGGVEPEIVTLEEKLWSEGEPLLIPLDPDAELFKFAQQNDLGQRLTREYGVEFAGTLHVAQIFEKGLVFAPVGQLDQITILTPPT
jgi:hypothetical protein